MTHRHKRRGVGDTGFRVAAGSAWGPARALSAVRSVLHRLGYRFRLGRQDLPGLPDLILPRWRTVVFVVDCGRYPHPGCAVPPAPCGGVVSGAGNLRLAQACEALGRLGWDSLVIQACETEDRVALGYRLDTSLQGRLIAGVGSARPVDGARA